MSKHLQIRELCGEWVVVTQGGLALLGQLHHVDDRHGTFAVYKGGRRHDFDLGRVKKIHRNPPTIVCE